MPAAREHRGALLKVRGDLEAAEAAWRRSVDLLDEETAALAREALGDIDD